MKVCYVVIGKSCILYLVFNIYINTATNTLTLFNKLTLLQNKTVYIANCRFFSTTNYKYTDDDSDYHSEISVVSDSTVDSNTSNAENKLKETRKKFEHYHQEGIQTRIDIRSTIEDMDHFLQEKASFLSSEQKREYDSFIEKETKPISEARAKLATNNAFKTEEEKRSYAESMTQITDSSTNLSKQCADFIRGALGHTLTRQDLNRLENIQQAQKYLSRDLLTITANCNILARREDNLKKVLDTQQQVTQGQGQGQGQGDATNIGESSRGVKRNREGSLEEQNTTKRQEIASSNQSNPSLLDDFADPSEEMPDYIGGDD